MSTIEKRLKKFYRKPIPNDITFEEIEVIAKYYGCQVSTGGNHSKKNCSCSFWNCYSYSYPREKRKGSLY